jgi:hypothetical protein
MFLALWQYGTSKHVRVYLQRDFTQSFHAKVSGTGSVCWRLLIVSIHHFDLPVAVDIIDFFNGSESTDGISHTNTTAALTFTFPIARASLEPALLNSLTRLRHGVPMLACRTSRLPDLDYQFEYTVPRSLDDALAWAKDVLFISDNAMSFEERHLYLHENRWWDCASMNYAFELHVAPSNSGRGECWVFQYVFSSLFPRGAVLTFSGTSLSIAHCIADGRSLFMLYDKLLGLLVDAIQGRGPPLSGLKWGKEVNFLPVPGPITWDIHNGRKPMLPAPGSLDPPPVPKDQVNLIIYFAK